MASIHSTNMKFKINNGAILRLYQAKHGKSFILMLFEFYFTMHKTNITKLGNKKIYFKLNSCWNHNFKH